MIVNNQPLTSKVEAALLMNNNLQGMPKVATQNRISNKSKCLSDTKHAYVHSSGSAHVG